MAKKTLLQMVQNILSSMDSDEVNSISDTVEAMQVAEVIRETYEWLVATLSIPERRGIVHLEGLGDISKPNYLKLPDTIKDALWIRYNGTELKYLSTEDFFNTVLQVTSNVTTVTDFNGVTYPVTNNSDPKYFTSFDDKHIACDAFNVHSDSTLQGSKSIAWADLNTPFVFEDDFICDLDDNFFPTLLAQAKNTCFVDLKQVNNANEQQKSRTGLVRVQNELNRIKRGNPSDSLPDYGRRR